METIDLVSITTDIKTEETGTLKVDRKHTDSLTLILNVPINNINKKAYFIKIFFADRPQIRHKIKLKKQNEIYNFSFINGTLILTEKDLHAAKIQEVTIGYKEDKWVSIIRSFSSLPKRVFITNLVSYSNSNTHFQLTGAKETQWYLPSISVTSIQILSLSLTIVLDSIHYYFNLVKKGHIYTIESPKFIPYTKGDTLTLYASISDIDTHNVLWFSQNTRFPLCKGLSYIQVELRGYIKQEGSYPVLLIPRNITNKIEVFNTELPVTKISVAVYKNSIYSLNYVATVSPTETDIPLKFLGDAGPRKIELSFKEGDTFTLINASIVIQKNLYYFVNKSLQTELFTLKHSEKRYKKNEETPKLEVL